MKKQYTIFEPIRTVLVTKVECDATLTPEEIYEYYSNGDDDYVEILDTNIDPQDFDVCGDYTIEENK